MGQPMSARERMLLAFTVCLALLVIPMTALAATGHLVNIADGTNAARVAKVNDVGGLLVETRPGFTQAVNNHVGRTGIGWIRLAEIPAGQRIVIVDVSISGVSGATGAFQATVDTFDVLPGASCGSIPSGTVRIPFRRVSVTNPGNTLLNFAGLPLTRVAPSGKKMCLA